MNGASAYPDNTDEYISRYAYCVRCGTRLDGPGDSGACDCPVKPTAPSDMKDVRSTATRRRSARTTETWEQREAAARPFLVAIVVARISGDRTAVAEAVRLAVATLMPSSWPYGVQVQELESLKRWCAADLAALGITEGVAA